MSRHLASNFLASHHLFRKRRHPAHQALRIVGISLAIFLGIALLVAVPFAYSAARMGMSADAGRRALMAAESDMRTLDFDSAIADAERARDAFVDARDRLDALRPLGIFPGVDAQIAAADALFMTGIDTSDAAREIFFVGRDVLAVASETRGVPPGVVPLPDPSTLFKDLSVDTKHQLLATLAANAPRLMTASERIDSALAALDRIPATGAAAPFLSSVAPLRARLVSAREAIGAAAPLSAILPSVLGYPNAKRYLFFFQNNDELRPTGGFLGVFGVIGVKDATLTEMRTEDVYSVDGPSERAPRPAPPVPIQKYLGVSKWFLRDANWSPDFPTSAALMEKFYREEAAVIAGAGKPIPQLDGILSITPTFAEEIMRVVGPVTIDGKAFDAANLVDALEFHVEQGFAAEGTPYVARKEIVGKLVTEVVARLSALPVSRLMDTARIAERNLAEGHIMVYANDPSLQQMFEAHDWAGKIQPVAGDYVQYVDANLAALKTDSVMERSLAYAIVPAKDGAYEGRVTMTYHNTGRFTWKTTRYRTYARVYVPAGSELIGVSGAMENDKTKDPARRPGKADVYDESGRRAFGAFISVEPGETRTLEFRFRLAPSVMAAIKDGSYRLDVEKQAGTGAIGLTLDLDLGKKLKTAAPPEDRTEWGDTRYRFATDLRINRQFDLGF